MGLVETYHAYREFAEGKGMPWIAPSALVNPVDRNAFNYSLEEPIIREFSSFTEFTHPYVCSTVQPCLRGSDFSLIKKETSGDHMILFHMMPVSYFLMPHVDDLAETQKESIRNTLEFLDVVGIDINRMIVSCFAGGYLDEVSNGLIPVHKYFPADSVSVNFLLELGLSSSQIKMVSNADTFMGTFSGADDFLAGYRFEIFYIRDDDSIIEIGTGEALGFKQLHEDGKTVDIVASKSCASAVVIGLERLQSVLEEKNDIKDISDFSNLAKALFPLVGEVNLKAVDYFRSAHLILAQTHSMELNSSLLRRRRRVVSGLCKFIAKKNIAAKDFLAALQENALLSPWSPELSSNLNIVSELMVENILRRRKR